MSHGNHARLLRGGLGAGLAIGLFTGFLISAPNFQIWPASLSLSVILGSAALGAFAGHMAMVIFVRYLIRGNIPDYVASEACDRHAGNLDRVAHDHHGSHESHSDVDHHD